jgi:hypothetical protein
MNGSNIRNRGFEKWFVVRKSKFSKKSNLLICKQILVLVRWFAVRTNYIKVKNIYFYIVCPNHEPPNQNQDLFTNQQVGFFGKFGFPNHEPLFKTAIHF